MTIKNLLGLLALAMITSVYAMDGDNAQISNKPIDDDTPIINQSMDNTAYFAQEEAKIEQKRKLWAEKFLPAHIKEQIKQQKEGAKQPTHS